MTYRNREEYKIKEKREIYKVNWSENREIVSLDVCLTRLDCLAIIFMQFSEPRNRSESVVVVATVSAS